LGIGLSEGTAIIVTGDRFEVMGKWKVAVHDNARLYQPWQKPYFVLEAGDVFNIKHGWSKNMAMAMNRSPSFRFNEDLERWPRPPADRLC
jgi:hypothetical protein